LKVICAARRWRYQKGDTVERLLAVVQREGLFPDYLGGYFTNLIGAMKAGVPKIRDRQGGHGAAPSEDPVPDHIAAFALHLTAANIVMLVKAYRALPPVREPPRIDNYWVDHISPAIEAFISAHLRMGEPPDRSLCNRHR
jgi:hypothetical protein